MKRILGILLSLMLLLGGLIVAPISASAAEPYVVDIARKVSTTAFAILSDGTTWGWGADVYDKLIDNTPGDKNAPVRMNIDELTAIADGGESVYALKKDGTVWAWGMNLSGAVGDGTKTDRNIPVQVKFPMIEGFLEIFPYVRSFAKCWSTLYWNPHGIYILWV